MKKYLILLIMLIFAIYLQVINFPFFAWDDNTYITENSNINTGFSFKGLVWSFTKGINISHYYHPITWLSNMLDCQLFGLNSGLHHLTSLFVHIANILLLYFALAKLTGEKRKSFFVAALFAVHPINVESVVWIAERKNLLSGFFWFLTIFAYAYYIERPEVKRYLLLILAFIVGLLSKPMVVTLPFVLLLLDYWPLNRFRFGMQDSKPVLFRLVREKLPLFILMILTVAVTYFGMERIGSLTSLETYSLQVRVGNSLVSYSKYIVKAFYPVNFGIHYMHPGNNIPLWQLIVSVLFLS